MLHFLVLTSRTNKSQILYLCASIQTIQGFCARFVRSLREEDLEKRPGVAETLDWAGALMGLGIEALDPQSERLHATLICLLKTEADLKSVTPGVLGRLAGRAA